MMKRKIPLWMFALSIILAIMGFVLRGQSNLNHYDAIFGLYAEQLYSDIEILELLKKNKVDEAKAILEKEVSSSGPVIAVCLMNDCSDKAKNVVEKFSKKSIFQNN